MNINLPWEEKHCRQEPAYTNVYFAISPMAKFFSPTILFFLINISFLLLENTSVVNPFGGEEWARHSPVSCWVEGVS